MRLRGIRAVLMQELFVTKASLEIIFDVFVFTLMNILLFGFISKYLAQDGNKLQAEGLLLAVVFWEVIRINQYSISISSMWNVWSHNLSNMFIAPIKITEYLFAHFISATIKSFLILCSAMVLVRYVFQFNILRLGLFPVAFSYINMVIFATAIGLVFIGLVFQYGTRIQAITWGTIFLLEPLSAVFFPVSVLPGFVQPIAYGIPVTYFFEWLRALHTGSHYGNGKIWLAFGYNILFSLLCCFIFSRQLAAAKRSGQFVRNDL